MLWIVGIRGDSPAGSETNRVATVGSSGRGRSTDVRSAFVHAPAAMTAAAASTVPCVVSTPVTAPSTTRKPVACVCQEKRTPAASSRSRISASALDVVSWIASGINTPPTTCAGSTAPKVASATSSGVRVRVPGVACGCRAMPEVSVPSSSVERAMAMLPLFAYSMSTPESWSAR
jgi:hypothetical protein